MPRRLLPIGIQTFRKIREGDYCYVDNTPFIQNLVEHGGYYFLARPRRFGKSLLVDTLDALFSGEEELFQGLFIHDKWDWRHCHPVIRISFGDGVLAGRTELDEKIHEILTDNENRLGG